VLDEEEPSSDDEDDLPPPLEPVPAVQKKATGAKAVPKSIAAAPTPAPATVAVDPPSRAEGQAAPHIGPGMQSSCLLLHLTDNNCLSQNS
jgi:hypothetical protein